MISAGRVWDYSYLKRMDMRALFITCALIVMGFLVISSTTGEALDGEHSTFWTSCVHNQLRSCILGGAIYLACAGMDYRKLSQWRWVLYGTMLCMLIGLYFSPSIQNVRRWYRIPFVGMAFQPSEYAKLIVVLTLSAFLERKSGLMRAASAAFQAIVIVFIPFVLILKQPDLGTALVLYPISLVLFYFGEVNQTVVRVMSWLVVLAMAGILCIFLGWVSHEELRPYATHIVKEYQYERLNPDTYHQRSAQIALALGGITGSGWKESTFTGGKWLPYAHTDSVFAAFGEEFGLIGIFFMLLFFFGLVYCGFQVAAVARDRFGRLLSAGITAYLAMHVLINMGMMSGLFPITGVPLILVSYGGSSMLVTMMALGLLQSIYSRRFMF